MCQVYDKQEASYWLTTAHRAKGLEAPYVQLADDFFDLNEPLLIQLGLGLPSKKVSESMQMQMPTSCHLSCSKLVCTVV